MKKLVKKNFEQNYTIQAYSTDCSKSCACFCCTCSCWAGILSINSTSAAGKGYLYTPNATAQAN